MSAARPAVTIHCAQTLDGRIATRSGSSQWISGDSSLKLAHELRASHDAVLVGVGTAMTDNPRLTVRLVPGRSPLRVVADSTLRLVSSLHVLTDRAAPTLVATTRRAPPERVAAVTELGAEVVAIAEDETGRVDLASLLAVLSERGIRSLLIEGGSAIITSALRAHLVDRLVLCIAPKVVGAGIETVGDLAISRMSEALTFTSVSFAPLGADIIFDGTLVHVNGRG